MSTFSVGGAFSKAIELFEKQWKVLVPAVFILLAISGGASALNIATGHTVNGVVHPNGLVSLIDDIISFIVSVGFLQLFLRVADGETGRLADLIPASPTRVVKAVVAAIILAICIGIGFILLIIPGFILIIRLGQVINLIIDQDLGILESFGESWRITNGNWWNLFGLSICTGFVGLLGVIFLGVGLLVSLPIAALAQAVGYTMLRDAGKPEAAESAMATHEPIVFADPTAPTAEMPMEAAPEVLAAPKEEMKDEGKPMEEPAPSETPEKPAA